MQRFIIMNSIPQFCQVVKDITYSTRYLGLSLTDEPIYGEQKLPTIAVHRFKVKGEEHAKGSGNIKTLQPVDEEFENIKIAFVNNYACTESRLEQAWQNTFGIENEIAEPSVALIGTFLRYVMSDVTKEESDIMNSLNLVPRQVNSLIARVAKQWFFTKL